MFRLPSKLLSAHVTFTRVQTTMQQIVLQQRDRFCLSIPFNRRRRRRNNNIIIKLLSYGRLSFHVSTKRFVFQNVLLARVSTAHCVAVADDRGRNCFCALTACRNTKSLRSIRFDAGIRVSKDKKKTHV